MPGGLLEVQYLSREPELLGPEGAQYRNGIYGGRKCQEEILLRIMNLLAKISSIGLNIDDY